MEQIIYAIVMYFIIIKLAQIKGYKEGMNIVDMIFGSIIAGCCLYTSIKISAVLCKFL